MSTNKYKMLINKILNRICEIEGIEKDADIARALHVSPGRLSNWRRRETIPLDVLQEYADRKKIPLQEVIFGKQTDNFAIQNIPE